MSSLNYVALIGNLGRDPEVRNLADGSPVMNLSLATSEYWQKDGQRQEKTEWHRVVIWDAKLCEIAEKYIKKGSKVYVSGRIQTREWEDQSGTKRQTTEIVLPKYGGKLVMLDSKPSNGVVAPVTGSKEDPQSPPAEVIGDNGIRRDPPELDDDLPF